MPFLALNIRPGIYREGTHYSNQGGWWDGDKIRFRKGLPEKIGGWLQYSTALFRGTCRALFGWSTLGNIGYLAVGTHLKYYVESGGLYLDITPIRRTATPLSNNPITTVNGSSTVTINDPVNGAILDDFVTISGATAFNGLTTGALNQEFQITEIVDANNYKVNTGVTANASSAGGGAAITAAYQINVGLDSTLLGDGWGAGAWGRNGWGERADTTVQGATMRLWTQDSWGQNLLFCVRDGGIYYWAVSATDRAISISALPSASNVPLIATEVAVSYRDRHAMAFGCNNIFETAQDQMLIRWSDAENLAEWTPATTNDAGDLRLSHGSKIITVVQTRQEILCWTDTSLYSIQFVGTPFVFGAFMLADDVDLIAPNAKCVINDVVYWMGQRGFYRYDGNVTRIPCSVEDYVYSDINTLQPYKTYCGSNIGFNEVWWLYTSASAEENDRYVVFNYADNIWYFGAMARTAWMDIGFAGNPIAAGTDGYLYNHETGTDDGSQNPPVALPSYIESSPIEIPPSDKVPAGDRFMSIWKMLPDFTFRDSSAAMPSLTFTVTPQSYPGAAYGTANSGAVTRSSIVTVEQFTQEKNLRVRGRSFVYRVASSAVGVDWRMGVQRLYIRPDGQR